MSTRRNFLATTGLVAAGVLAGTTRGVAAEAKPAPKKYDGPHELPKRT